MGKPTGFKEFQRELPPDRPVHERVKDYGEFHLQHPEAKLRQQGARCGAGRAAADDQDIAFASRQGGGGRAGRRG